MWSSNSTPKALIPADNLYSASALPVADNSNRSMHSFAAARGLYDGIKLSGRAIYLTGNNPRKLNIRIIDAQGRVSASFNGTAQCGKVMTMPSGSGIQFIRVSDERGARTFSTLIID
jgi:hypothetical protein